MRTLSLFAGTVVVLSACRTSESEFAGAPVAPELEMAAPGAADWRQDGPMIAKGSARGLSSVEVNGSPAIVSGDAWSAEIALARGVNVVEVRGVDSTGTTHYRRHGVLAGDFGSASDPVSDGIVARINRGGLDVLLGKASGLLDASELNTMVAGTTVYSDSYGILGWNAVEVEADLGWLWFDAPELSADPRPDMLDVTVDLPALDLWVPVRGQVVGIDFDVDAWLWCEDAVVEGTLEVYSRNGELRADLVDVDVNLVGFDFDTSLLPGSVESWLLVDTVRGALEDMLVEKVQLLLPPLIESQLADLELAFDTDLMGVPLQVSADFVDVKVDSDGLQITADVNANSPDAGIHGAVGPLVTVGSAPSPERDADFGISLSDDLLNRFVFELWAGGLLDLTLSTADGALDPALLADLGARDEAEIRVNPVLPPVLVERDGRAQLQMGELEVEILTPGGEHGERIALAVNAFADVELAVQDGVAQLSLGEPTVDFIVRDTDWNARNETLTNLLEHAVPVDALLGTLGELSFPLPSLAGISVVRAEVDRDKSGAHTSIGLKLQ